MLSRHASYMRLANSPKFNRFYAKVDRKSTAAMADLVSLWTKVYYRNQRNEAASFQADCGPSTLGEKS